MLERFGESMLAIWRVGLTSMRCRMRIQAVHPTNALTPAQNPDRLVDHVSMIRHALIETSGYDVVVCGHTHKSGCIGDWYFNSGSWVGKNNQFLRVAPDGHVRYFEWRQGRAIEKAMPVVLSEAEPEKKRGFARVKTNSVNVAMKAAKTVIPGLERPTRARTALFAEGLLALLVGARVLWVTRDLGVRAGMRVLVLAFSAYAIADGILSFIFAKREAPVRRVLSWVRGGASVLFGLIMLARGQGIDAIAILVGGYALIAGTLRVAAALLLEEILESSTVLWIGIGAMLAGLALLFLPTQTYFFKYAMVAYLFYWGFGQIGAAFTPRRTAKIERELAETDIPHTPSRPSHAAG
jgi:hypothetical protein